jgi:hypothetical protein
MQQPSLVKINSKTSLKGKVPIRETEQDLSEAGAIVPELLMMLSLEINVIEDKSGNCRDSMAQRGSHIAVDCGENIYGPLRLASIRSHRGHSTD